MRSAERLFGTAAVTIARHLRARHPAWRSLPLWEAAIHVRGALDRMGSAWFAGRTDAELEAIAEGSELAQMLCGQSWRRWLCANAAAWPRFAERWTTRRHPPLASRPRLSRPAEALLRRHFPLGGA